MAVFAEVPGAQFCRLNRITPKNGTLNPYTKTSYKPCCPNHCPDEEGIKTVGATFGVYPDPASADPAPSIAA